MMIMLKIRHKLICLYYATLLGCTCAMSSASRLGYKNMLVWKVDEASHDVHDVSCCIAAVLQSKVKLHGIAESIAESTTESIAESIAERMQ